MSIVHVIVHGGQWYGHFGQFDRYPCTSGGHEHPDLCAQRTPVHSTPVHDWANAGRIFPHHHSQFLKCGMPLKSCVSYHKKKV
jgi:hypothetical protein